MSHQAVNQTSGNFEYYTPTELIERVRRVLGTIDLDPATSLIANKVIQANAIFTTEDNGLSKLWHGKVFMNHPFHKGEAACPGPDKTGKARCVKKACVKRGYHLTESIPSNLKWITHLVNEYKSGRVHEAICITFSSMSETWMEPLLEYPQCFPRGRINYMLPDGTRTSGITKGSLLTYMGPNPELFKTVFSEIGKVK
jgi:hypothetical protein